MAANYLHGVETLEIERGPRVIRTVKSAVIALIGTAPTGPVNEQTLCLGDTDSAQFGPKLSGFTIPQALATINRYGAGSVIVINVLDPDKHSTAVEDEAVTFAAGVFTASLAHGAVRDLSLKSEDGATTYELGKDYTLASDGTLTRIKGGQIPTGAVTLKAAYDYADPSKVMPSDIIGGIDAAGRRTGMQALKDSYNLFGFFAKILISPVFGTLNSVSVELSAMASHLGGVAYIDAPIGTTFAQVMAGRGPAGSINFNTSSDRVRLCYPHVKVLDTNTDAEMLEPLSTHAAGLRCKVDLEKGYWWSSSNQELSGVLGIERPLSAMIDDPQCEVNLLNEVGITTVFNSYGTGYRLWGNRSAAWPTVTHMRNFESVRRTADMTNESIRYSSLQFNDRPIDQALIDTILESTNGYGRKQIGDGALLGFKAWFDPKRNEETELANGHLLISYKLTPPVPAERLTYESECTLEYMVNLRGGE